MGCGVGVILNYHEFTRKRPPVSKGRIRFRLLPASGRRTLASNLAHHAGFPLGGECMCKGGASRRGRASPATPPPDLGFDAPPPTRQHSNASGQIEPGQHSRLSDLIRTWNAARAFHSRTGTKFQIYRRAELEPGGHVDRANLLKLPERPLSPWHWSCPTPLV